ncbi:unnamed protein product [Closterium sp. Naga37s-1]|nr:unnamed protein product [Closterium sp. Naga37s-1]
MDGEDWDDREAGGFGGLGSAMGRSPRGDERGRARASRWGPDKRDGGESRDDRAARGDERRDRGGDRRTERGSDGRGNGGGWGEDGVWRDDRRERGQGYGDRERGRERDRGGEMDRWRDAEGDGGRGHAGDRGAGGRRDGGERGERQQRQERRDREGSDAVPALYSIHHATVHSIRPFGMFVRLEGHRKHGLVHLSHVSDYEVAKRDDTDDAKVEALKGVAAEGEQVWVKVISLKDETGADVIDTTPGLPGSANIRIGCSMKVVSQTDGADRDPSNQRIGGGQGGGGGEMDRWRDAEGDGGRGHAGDRGAGGRRDGGERQQRQERRDREGSDAVPALYSIHRATVHSIRPFGMFVRLDGHRKHGLVHLSHVSDYEVAKRDDTDDAKVEALKGVAAEGEQVWVKVISLKDETGADVIDTTPGLPGSANIRVGCSMKVVSQTDGADRDPSNQRIGGGQGGGSKWKAPLKLELEAVLNVTCTRCGGQGHLKTECYGPVGASYELLADDAGEERIAVDGGGGGAGVGRGGGRGGGGGGGLLGAGGGGRGEFGGRGGDGGRRGMDVADVDLRGRGRGLAMTQPAWMTAQQKGMAIGGAIGDGSGRVGSVREEERVDDGAGQEGEERGGEKKDRRGEREERRREKERKREEKAKEKEKGLGIGSVEDALRIIEEMKREKKERRERKKARKEAKRERRKRRGGDGSSSSDSSGSEKKRERRRKRRRKEESSSESEGSSGSSDERKRKERRSRRDKKRESRRHKRDASSESD